MFLPGAGTSILIEQLIEKGATLILNDISVEALNKVRRRFFDNAHISHYLCQDIAQPLEDNIPNGDERPYVYGLYKRVK